MDKLEPINKNCAICGIEFTPVRKDALYCSPQCKRVAFKNRSVGTDKRPDGTDNVIVLEPIIEKEVEFHFTIRQRPGAVRGDEHWDANKDRIRTAKYWYDVPLAAVPVLKDGWPEIPVFETIHGPEQMDGRQYFLWWKNDFDTKDDRPVVYSPFPTMDNVRYEMGGEHSRRWGA